LGESIKWCTAGSVPGPIFFLININDLDIGVMNWIFEFADDTKYTMNGVVLEVVEAEKDLGIMISHDLKTSNQCMRPCANVK